MHIMMTKEQFDMLKQKAKGGGSSDGEKEDKSAEAKDSQGKESSKDNKGKGAASGKDKGKEKVPRIELKEDDDTHGTLDTDDVMLNYYYNSQEGRLYLSIAKKHTLAAYCAGDSISGTFVMDILSAMPNPESKSKESGGGKGVGGDKDKSNEAHKGEGGNGEGQEKKEQEHQQQPSQ